MSSDVDDDQVLPDSLQKLEIVPIYCHSQTACKTNNEREQNPFFSELSRVNGIDDRITKDLFGPTCINCEINDNPCGGNNSLNSNSKDASAKSWRHRGNSLSQCIEHNINKQVHFKHRDKEKSQILSEKKLTILRDPILKSIGRSMYHNGNQNKLCCETIPTPSTSTTPSSSSSTTSNLNDIGDIGKTELDNTTTAGWFGRKLCGQKAAEQLKANCVISKRSTDLITNKLNNQCYQQGPGTSDTNSAIVHKLQNWQLNDVSTVDFKTLINQCDHLSLSTQDTAINSIIELHKTKNFQVLQANQIANTLDASLNDSHDLNLPINTSIQATTLAGAGAGNLSMMNNSNVSNNSSNSSSCSQQARMNSSNCDVTIDELASYIEFQLHLPKPMSSNVYEAMFS